MSRDKLAAAMGKLVFSDLAHGESYGVVCVAAGCVLKKPFLSLSLFFAFIVHAPAALG